MKGRLLMIGLCAALGSSDAAAQTKEKAAAGEARLDVEYGFTLERGDKTSEVGHLREVSSGDRFQLRLRPRQATFAYLFVGRDDGSYDLVLPNETDERSARLARNEWSTVPETDWLRFNRERGIDRIYLVLASAAVPELDEMFAAGKKQDRVDETWVVDLRNRLEAPGSTTEDTLARSTRITHRRRGSPAVVVKEFTIRHK